jgi:4-amino-4-deoxy-L-arabinose transferase-like glycosyltransferase
MQRRAVQRLSLLAVVLLATVLRVYQLKDVPAGLFCDEAAMGYNAYAIATAGMDENGLHFPLFFWSFSGYKNPVYIYAAAIPIKLFGLDEFTTRLPAALFGVGGVIAIFYLGRALFNPWVGLFAALLLTVAPWHLHFSRIAFELISFPFLFLIGFTLVVRFTQGRRTLVPAMVFFGLCVYAYAIATVFVPLFLIGFGVLYLPTLLRRWLETVLAVAVALAMVTPAGIFYRHHPQGTQYFQNTTMLRPGTDMRGELRAFGRNYAEFFSPVFLFRHGDAISRHAVRGFGELLPFYAPFLIVGAVVALLRRDRPSKLVLWWLALYPIGPSLMTEIPSASRGIIGAPAFCLLSAVGLAATVRFIGWAARWRPLALVLQTAALGVAASFLVPDVVRYVKTYFVEYPKYSAPTYGGFQYGYRDAIHYMESQRANYDLLMMTAVEVNQPQIFPLFYNHMDPRKWAASGHSPQGLGYLILDPTEYGRYSMNQRILYALRPGDLDIFSDYTIHKKITAPGGQVEFVIAEVRARKRFITNWLVLGPFANQNSEGVKKEFIDLQHLTKNRYKGAFGEIYWRPITPQFVRVDLNVFFANSDPLHPGNPEYVCAYAAVTVRSPKAQSAFLELSGSDDYLQGWLNGGTLTPWPLMLSATPKRRPIELAAGRNLLMVKSCESVGGWYFTARITDADGRDVPDVTTAAELPEGEIAAPAPPPDAHLQLVEGFDAIVAFKRTANPYPDYRGGTESWWANVHEQPGELVWRTAPCPEKKRTVFVFSASMSEEPGEAELFVNGNYALTFNTSGEPGVRSWSHGPYQLTFMSKGLVAGNSGIALLDVPADQITAGQPVQIRVFPARGADNSWFMVKSYRDTISHENVTPQMAAEAIRGAWQSRAAE